jgi:FixJ family two-component response regulator
MMTDRRLVAVVDDDADLLTAFGRVLRAGGFEAVLYRSAEQFLASPPAHPVHCLVVDVTLGGMSGLDLQRHLRTKGSTVPIVVMTAFESARVRDEAYRLGCAGVLDKQADIDEVLTLIRSF